VVFNFWYLFTYHCGRPNRPQYGSCPSVRLSVLYGLLNRKLKGAEKPRVLFGHVWLHLWVSDRLYHCRRSARDGGSADDATVSSVWLCCGHYSMPETASVSKATVVHAVTSALTATLDTRIVNLVHAAPSAAPTTTSASSASAKSLTFIRIRTYWMFAVITAEQIARPDLLLLIALMLLVFGCVRYKNATAAIREGSSFGASHT